MPLEDLTLARFREEQADALDATVPMSFEESARTIAEHHDARVRAYHCGVDPDEVAEVQAYRDAACQFLAGEAEVDLGAAMVVATQALNEKSDAATIAMFQKALQRIALKHRRDMRGRALMEARRSPRCMPRARSPRRHVRRRRAARGSSSRSEPDDPEPGRARRHDDSVAELPPMEVSV